MAESPISISPSGVICLGPRVVCDGFVYGVPYRVQTHIHDDHMRGFPESKGYQEIYLTQATRRLLEAEYNADIEVRENIRAVDTGVWTELDGVEIQLLPASHMLGAVQVAVTLPGGLRAGYSGDIGWPVERVIQVDYLVIDSTNGSPQSIRQYTQLAADERLLELVTQRLRVGSVHITAHRGTLQRALQLLAGSIACPVLASHKRLREISVYRDFAYATPEILDVASPQGQLAKRENRCVFVYSKGDKRPVDYPRGDTHIVLSAFMCSGPDPYMEYSEYSHRVALSDHADYQGIVEYVRATGAKHVLVDGTRGGHGLDLAVALRDELGIVAEQALVAPSRAWGK